MGGEKILNSEEQRISLFGSFVCPQLVKCNRCRRRVGDSHLCGLVQQEMQGRLLTLNLKVVYPGTSVLPHFVKRLIAIPFVGNCHASALRLKEPKELVKVLPVHLEAPQSRCLRVFDGFHWRPTLTTAGYHGSIPHAVFPGCPARRGHGWTTDSSHRSSGRRGHPPDFGDSSTSGPQNVDGLVSMQFPDDQDGPPCTLSRSNPTFYSALAKVL